VVPSILQPLTSAHVHEYLHFGFPLSFAALITHRGCLHPPCPTHKLLGRTLSVDHCADYKPPESDSDGEGPSGVGGIAPVAVSTSDEEEPDSVDLYLDQSKKKKDKKDKKEKKAKKKEKKEKKAKKKEAKAAKEHRRSPSGTPSADEEVRCTRPHQTSMRACVTRGACMYVPGGLLRVHRVHATP
jgi:hypothetical protein